MLIDEFKKTKEFLICVDSDGCAMDTMDIKHKKCFGPCLIAEWGLEERAEEILARWNEINLYSITRGINRFKGLAVILSEINEKITAIDGLDTLLSWAESTNETSNASIRREIERTNSQCLKKALNWSLALNRAIDALSDECKQPFAGVKETLSHLHEFADIAVVSSANNSAVVEEWTKYGLIDNVDIVLTQESGDKAHCIAKMKSKGYGDGNALMIGDAVGDLEAALLNNVFFYPILVRREVESWLRLDSQAAALFREGRMDLSYRESLIKEFYENFSK